MSRLYNTYNPDARDYCTPCTALLCDLSDMEPKDRLRQARERAGYKTAKEAAQAIRVNQNTLSSNENGNRAISRRMAQVYAEAFGVSAGWILYGEGGDAKASIERKTPRSRVPIMGEVAAGLWLEADVFEPDQDNKSHLLPLPDYPANAQYLLRVRGTSLNKIALPGDLIWCLDYGASGTSPSAGDLAVIERFTDGGGKIERTAKRIAAINGKIELVPESTDPRFKDPLIYDDGDPEFSLVIPKAKILYVIRQP